MDKPYKKNSDNAAKSRPIKIEVLHGPGSAPKKSESMISKSRRSDPKDRKPRRSSSYYKPGPGAGIGPTLEALTAQTKAPLYQAAAANITGAGGANLVFTSACDTPRTGSVSNGGGPIMGAPSVQLIFWGNSWTGTPTPSAGQIVNAVSNIISGPYISALSQYGVGPATLRGAIIALTNPPNPFQESDVQGLVSALIDQGTFPEPDDPGGLNFYAVIMPAGVNLSGGGATGRHSYDTDYDFPFDWDRAWYCWVMNNGTLDSVTTIFSHELVEACSDPEGDGIQMNPSNSSNWNEIGDACCSAARLNGVMVQSYWSDRDKACIIPNGLPTWVSMGGVITGGLSSVRNRDGRLEVFARGTDGALWHLWQTAPNNGWSGWASLGGVITGRNVATNNQDGRIEVFARGTDGALWHIWQTAPNNGWSGWASRGGQISSDLFAVGRNADGRLEVFVKGTDNALWHIWQTAPNNGWSSWASRGGQIQSVLGVINNADGRLEVFTKGLDGALWHIWQTAPNNGWSGWASRGGTLVDLLAVGRNADGRLEVFARGTDNALWHIWQTAPNNGWSGWASRGGSINDVLAVANNRDGRLEVFARGTDNALWHIWQTAPNNGWSGWATFGGGVRDLLTVNNNADGRMEVFVRGMDNALWHIWQTSPSNGWNG